MTVLFYILAAVVLVIINFIVAFFTRIAYKTNRTNKMYLNINKIFDNLITVDEVNNSYERNFKIKKQSKDKYDYLFITKNYEYYIKVIPNFNLNEITVNSSVKWYVRKKNKSGYYLTDIEGFIRMDMESQNKKKVRKIIIVYPDSHSLLRYINDCELEFITPKTDVYGCQIITYKELVEHLDLIEL